MFAKCPKLSTVIFSLFAIAITACQSTPPPPTETPTPSATPSPTLTPSLTPFIAARQDITISLPPGDVERGEYKTLTRGCVGCHMHTKVGPAWEPSEGNAGIGEIAALRITQEDYTGAATSAEEYLFESMVVPSAYVVEGYADKLMPDRFGDLVSVQDVADIIAYLLTIR